jgi:hypothetical protein
MDDLIAFVRAQLDEDERAARAATAGPWWHNPGKAWLNAEAFEVYDRSKGEEFVGYGESPLSGCVAATGPANHPQSMADAVHIARWDPARVLAEVEAKRRIVEMWVEWHGPARDDAYHAGRRDQLTEDVKALAQPYAGRDGWREEWSDTPRT